MITLRGLAASFIAVLITIGLLLAVRVGASLAAPAGEPVMTDRVGADPLASINAPTGDLVTATQTNIADFNTGNFYLTGMTRNGDGEVTLLQVGIAGEWLTQTNATGLIPRYEHASIAYKDRIYVFGGRTPNYTRSIQFSSINTITHNLNNWITATTDLASSIYTDTTFGNGVAGLAAVQWGRWVYLMGGYDGFHQHLYDVVSYAAINTTTGQLSPLTKTASLPQALSNGQAVVLNNRIYYMGGIYNTGFNVVNTVYYATPDPVTGAITAWMSTTAPLPYKTTGQMAATTVNNRIYAMSGITNSTSNGSTPEVFFAEPLASGDIISWTEAQPMPQSVYGGAAVSFAGQVYDTGGAWGFDITSPSPYVVAGLDVLPNGVGGWVSTSGIEPARLLHTAVVNADGWLYIVGGSNGANQPIQQGVVNIAATTGDAGSAYANGGTYLAQPFDFTKNYILHQLSWVSTVPPSTTLGLRYRTALVDGIYSNWSDWYVNDPGSGHTTTTLPLTLTARYLQYQVALTTTDTITTPMLEQVSLYAEVPTPPEFHKLADPPGGTNVNTGDLITYSVTYSNVSNNAMSHIVIVDPIPTMTTYISGSIFAPPGVISYVESSYAQWTIAVLPPHSGGTVGFVVRVNDDVPEGTIVPNNASLTSDQSDVLAGVSHVVGLLPTLAKSHVTAGPLQAQPGDLVTYTLAYNNPNVLTATGVIITDVLPVQLIFVSGTPAPSVLGNTLHWVIGDLPPGVGGAVTFTVRVASTAADGSTVQNVAQLRTAETVVRSNTDLLGIQYRYDLQLTQVADKTKAPPGSIVNYTFYLTNSTDVNLTLSNVAVEVDLAPGLPGLTQTHVFDCLAPCTGWNFDSEDADGYLIYSRTIDSLGPNQSMQMTMAVLISPTTPPDVLAVESFSGASDDGQHGFDSNPPNQYDYAITTVNGPDIWVKQLLASARGIPKQNLKVKVVLTNDGFVQTKGPDNTGWFGVDLYLKPAGAPPPFGPEDRYLGACPNQLNPCTGVVRFDTQYQAYGVYPASSLNVDQVITMTFPLTVVTPGTYWLYAQADTFWNENPAIYGTAAHGRVIEGNEDNNILGPIEIVIAYAKVYLPIIRR
jgi:uncharacterized repeat protein (TIGR01451 family)